MDELVRYEVYYLDMWKDPQGWTENERFKLGLVDVVPGENGEVGAKNILEALMRFEYFDWFGNKRRVLDTTDRRRVYAEDLYGCGDWWEVGTVKGHMPVYGLKEVA